MRFTSIGDETRKLKQDRKVAAHSSQETRDRIIDAAEMLFADHGFRAVSLRQITRQAGVNTAAVNYHFGSRESLVFEVLTRVIGPINEQRLRLLTEAERESGGNAISIEKVLDAFYRPVVSQLAGSEIQSTTFLKLAGRCLAEQREEFPGTMVELFAEIAERFGRAARRSLPHLSEVDIFWRFHFSVGTLLYALTHADRLSLFSHGTIEGNDPDETLSRLIDFTAAGMRAEAPKPSKKTSKTGLASVCLAGLLFQTIGCATPDSPADAKHFVSLKTPEHWVAGSPYQHASYADYFWVDCFGDKILSALVRETLTHNRDLKAAQSRIAVAAANARIAGADLYPQISGGWNGRRSKQNFVGFPIPGAPSAVLSTQSNQFGLSLDLSWEIDLWGRIRAARASSIAAFEASQFDRATAELSIAGQAVKTWFALAEAKDQTALARQTLSVYQHTERTIRDRFQSGVEEAGRSLGSQLLLAQADVATARDTLAARKELLGRTSRQLEVLAGKYPAGTAGKSARLPAFPSSIPADLPATLLDRRPDLAAAERRIAATDQQLLEAKKMLLPTIGLTTSVGTTSGQISDLLNGNFSVWSLAGNLAQPILQGGRLRANVKRRQAERDVSAAEFEQAALTAFSEVENALSAETFFAHRVVALEDATRLSRSAFNRALEEYSAGTGDLLTMLTAQQRVFAQESQLLSVRRMRLENRVNLHLALGGSFRKISPPAAKRSILARPAENTENGRKS